MSVSRRKFLGIIGAGAGTVAGLPKIANAGVENFEGYPDRYGMLTDVTRCIGCRSCEMGCNEHNSKVHGLPAPKVPFEDLSVLNTKRRTTSDAFTVVNKYQPKAGGAPVFRKIQCNHCNEPACVSACFVKALKKTKEGPVIYDKSLCVGCRYCIVACPFYIPTYEYEEALTPRVMKCTMCFDRVSEGVAPACAMSCPMGAITFGKRSDLLAIARDRIRREPDKYVDHVYGENEVGGLSWMYISGTPFDEIELPTNLGTVPYPKFTKGALASVPVIVMLWPVLLGGAYYMTRRRAQICEAERKDAVATAIVTTTEQEKEKAAKAQEMALKRQQTQLENAKKKEIKEAVDEAIEKTKQELSGEPAPSEEGGEAEASDKEKK